jgi:AcrR family transcriptional regulator
MTETRKPGRPRSAEADRAILSTTVELLATEGLRGLSIERVAERAGVGKTTIYRRWPTKRELAEAALQALFVQMEHVSDVPDTGSVRGDLVEAAAIRMRAVSGTQFLLPRLALESEEDAEFHRLVNEILVEPARAPIIEVLRRGVERGELRADLDLELACDLFLGPFLYRLLVSRGNMTDIARMVGPALDHFLRAAAP